MKEIESLKKQLNEVNRDILGMLEKPNPTEHDEKVLRDAIDYRASLEDDLKREVAKTAPKDAATNDPQIIGFIVINLN